MSDTIDLGKVNLSLGAPLYRIDGDFGDGEFVRYTETTKSAQILEGLDRGVLVLRPSKRKRSWTFEVTLLESSAHCTYLFAAIKAGIGLPFAWKDGGTEIFGTCQVEGIPDSAKSAAGTTRTYRILVVNSETTHGPAAEAG